MNLVGGHSNMMRGHMDGVGCHAIVLHAIWMGLDVIVTCLAVICMVLGDILGGHSDMVEGDSNMLGGHNSCGW